MAIPACLLRRSAPSSIYHLTSGEAKQLGSCEFSDPRTLRQSLVFRSGRLHTCHRRLHAFQRVFQSIAFNRQALVSRPSLVEVRSERLESYHGGVSCRVAQCYWHSIDLSRAGAFIVAAWTVENEVCHEKRRTLVAQGRVPFFFAAMSPISLFPFCLGLRCPELCGMTSRGGKPPKSFA